jgi:hypothetical protein
MYSTVMVSVALLVALLGFPLLEKRFESPESLGITPHVDAAWWKRALILWNVHVRYSGLFVLWIGLCGYLVKARRAPDVDGTAFLLVAGVGVLAFLCGLLWRKFVNLDDNVAT